MWGQLISAGASILGSVIGGKVASNAAKGAAQIQADAAEREAIAARAAANEVNPYIAQGYERVGQDVYNVTNTAGDVVESRASDAAQAATGAAGQANTYLDPYRSAGEFALTNLTELATAKAPTAADLEMDPGYQFRLSEGQKALERSAAARGTLQGGGTLKALTRYAQGAASQEYANAFDRFMRLQEGRRTALTGLSNLGSTAATQSGTNLTNAAQYGGTLMTNAAVSSGNFRTRGAEYQADTTKESIGLQTNNILNAEAEARRNRLMAADARAAGRVGAANAWGNAIGGAANAIGQGALTLGGMSKRRGGINA